jgi:hypothetical protein
MKIMKPRLFVTGAAGAMRTHLAKYVATILHLQPATYNPIAYQALLHGPVGFQS